AHLMADGDLLEADEHADAVVDVDDVIAHLEVAEVGEEGARRRLTALRADTLLVEDVRLGIEPELRVGQADATREHARGDEQGGPTMRFAGTELAARDVVVAQDLGD